MNYLQSARIILPVLKIKTYNKNFDRRELSIGLEGGEVETTLHFLLDYPVFVRLRLTQTFDEQDGLAGIDITRLKMF